MCVVQVFLCVRPSPNSRDQAKVHCLSTTLCALGAAPQASRIIFMAVAFFHCCCCSCCCSCCIHNTDGEHTRRSRVRTCLQQWALAGKIPYHHMPTVCSV